MHNLIIIYNLIIMILVIIILIIFFTKLWYDRKYTKIPKELFTDDKLFLWQYWDNIDNNLTPAYINLCMKSVDKYCSNTFNIVRLNKDNIIDYLPEINNYNLDNLLIAHKVDLYRMLLLYKYGGLYLDADVLVLRDPKEIIDKLYNNDFVGFGCTGSICNNGYGYPSNWIIASRPNTELMKNIIKNISNKLRNQNNFEYHDLGKIIIWDELNKLINNENYKYFHYPNKIDGSRDKNGAWVDSFRAFSNDKIEYDDENNMIFFVIYNSDIPKEIKNMSENDLLNKDWNFTRFVKKTF